MGEGKISHEYYYDEKWNLIEEIVNDQYNIYHNFYTYDSKGNLVEENNEDGRLEYSYDAYGNLMEELQYYSSGGESPGSKKVYHWSNPRAQTVPIPDTAFLYALFDEGVDSNEDSLISYAEAEAITTLDVSQKGIIDLSGIETFINLTELRCTDNKLNSVDLSNNLLLRYIWLSGNPISILDLTNNTLLHIAYLNNMQYLTQVCVTYRGFFKQITGSPNVYFTGDCMGNQVSIPDTAFLYALFDEGVDSNGDSLITYFEASQVTTLRVGGEGWYEGQKDPCFFCADPSGISDLSGIEAFTNLDTLICHCSNLTELILSDNKGISYLDCSNNQIVELDVTNNNKLTTLKCSNNLLTNLDVSNASDLNLLKCYGNQLNSLDFSNNPKLSALWCNHNQLSDIHLRANPALKILNCDNNQLSEIDVSGNLNLVGLICDYNQLSYLDITHNPDLRQLSIGGMPSLYQVCVLELPFPLDNFLIEKQGSPNVNFADCKAPELVAASEILYQAGYIEATSTEDGMIYLVSGNTEQYLDLIRVQSIDSVEAVAVPA